MGLYLRNAPEDSKILASKFSILVKSVRQNKIYKMPLLKHSLGDLLIMHLQRTSKGTHPEPQNKNFFVFKLLHGSLTIVEARKCFQSFATAVFRALVAFHEVGFAHLDIRLPNICFEEHGGEWIALLIDVDNAVAVDYGHVAPNSSSVMLSAWFDDNTKKDWRQYS